MMRAMARIALAFSILACGASEASYDKPVKTILTDAGISRKYQIPTLAYSAIGGSATFLDSSGKYLQEGAKIWSDRGYTFGSLRKSGFPERLQYWMGPHSAYPGSKRQIVLNTPVPGHLYFWSEVPFFQRDGNFFQNFGNHQIGTMKWSSGSAAYDCNTYQMDVVAGQTVRFELPEGREFTGGFGWLEFPTLTYSAIGGSATFLEAHGKYIQEGAKIWSDRNYKFGSLSKSGFPERVRYWMGPHNAFPGSNRQISLRAPVNGTLYFWSEVVFKRDGDFKKDFAKHRIGSMKWWSGPSGYECNTYEMAVVAGQTVHFELPDGKDFIGGFGWMEFPTLAYSAVGGSVTFLDARYIQEGAKIWSDRDYKFGSLSQSGFPKGVRYWMGPHNTYPGSKRKIVLTTPVNGTVYFWSEVVFKRDGNFKQDFAKYRIGSMQWRSGTSGYDCNTYKMAVLAGQIVHFELPEGKDFIGGFAWQGVASAEWCHSDACQDPYTIV